MNNGSLRAARSVPTAPEGLVRAQHASGPIKRLQAALNTSSGMDHRGVVVRAEDLRAALAELRALSSTDHAPVAWRFMHDGGWNYSAIDPALHLADGSVVEPLYSAAFGHGWLWREATGFVDGTYQPSVADYARQKGFSVIPIDGLAVAIALNRLCGAVDDFWNDARRIEVNGRVRETHTRAITAAQTEAGYLLGEDRSGRAPYDRRPSEAGQ